MATLNLNKKNVPLVLLLMLILLPAHSQQSPDSLYNVFKQHVLYFQNKYNNLYWDDEVKLAYYQLIEESPESYLTELTNDNNPAIRANIFGALMAKSKNTDLLRKLLGEHANDTASFTQVDGDVGYQYRVNDFMKMQYNFKIKYHLNTTNLLDRYEQIRKAPHWLIKGVTHQNITKENLLLLDSLAYSVKNVSVNSFHLYINDTTLVSNSNKLTVEMKMAIFTLHTGDLITFDMINGTDEKKQTVRLPSISLWIKDY